MFKILGVVVAFYVLYAAFSGKVVAKSGPWGRIVSRDESPKYFWVVIMIYSVMSIALLTIF